jgi:TonB family protein
MNQKIVVIVAILVLIVGYFVFSDQNDAQVPMTQSTDSSPPAPPVTPEVVASEAKPDRQTVLEPAPPATPVHPEYTDDGYPWNEALRPINPDKPSYPIAARREGVEGDVVATFVVNSDGSTENCVIESATNIEGEEIRSFNWKVCETIEGFQYPEIAQPKETKIKFYYRLTDE